MGFALRPLRRRVPSRTAVELDEVATANETARNNGELTPVMRGRPMRWLSLNLVVDESTSMLMWQSTVHAFERLLIRQGIFRDVRRWSLQTEGEGPPRLMTGRHRRGIDQAGHELNELLEPTGTRVILVVSDCCSPGWRSGSVSRTVEEWAKHVPLALVQTLPSRLWSRTALVRALQVQVGAGAPAAPNSRLEFRVTDDWFDPSGAGATGPPVPVLTLDREDLRLWARLVAGARGVWMDGFVVNMPSPAPAAARRAADAPLAPEARLRLFNRIASPQARELVRLLAVMEVRLPIVNLVREAFLPDAGQTHVAEVLLSGLIQPTMSADTTDDPDEVLYEFVEGVRPLLLHGSSYRRQLEVVSRYLAEQRPGARTQTMLVRGSRTRLGDLTATTTYAQVPAAVLREWGYPSLAGKLEQAAPSVEEHDFAGHAGAELRMDLAGALGRIELVRGDIFEQQVDALVIPSSEYLDLTGRVGGSLEQRVGASDFGQQLLTELRANVPLAPDRALVTAAGPLPTRHLIFVSVRSETRWPAFTPASVARGVAAALVAAEDLDDVYSLALPAVGVGAAGLDPYRVAPAVVDAIATYLQGPSHLSKIVFVFDDEAAYAVYASIYRALASEASAAPVVEFEDDPRLTADVRKRLSLQLRALAAYLMDRGFELPRGPITVSVDTRQPLNSSFIPVRNNIRIGETMLDDPDVAFREYMHFALTSGGRVGGSRAAIAIESGLADYFVASFTLDPLIAATWARDALRQHAVRTLANDRRFEMKEDSPPQDLGEVWGGLFWDLRQRFESDAVDRAVRMTWQSFSAEELAGLDPLQFGNRLLGFVVAQVESATAAEVGRLFARRGLVVADTAKPVVGGHVSGPGGEAAPSAQSSDPAVRVANFSIALGRPRLQRIASSSLPDEMRMLAEKSTDLYFFEFPVFFSTRLASSRSELRHLEVSVTLSGEPEGLEPGIFDIYPRPDPPPVSTRNLASGSNIPALVLPEKLLDEWAQTAFGESEPAHLTKVDATQLAMAKVRWRLELSTSNSPIRQTNLCLIAAKPSRLTLLSASVVVEATVRTPRPGLPTRLFSRESSLRAAQIFTFGADDLKASPQ
jgi:O-acetyl-ADP-ribose deacetylase (regulator of RNase III)